MQDCVLFLACRRQVTALREPARVSNYSQTADCLESSWKLKHRWLVCCRPETEPPPSFPPCTGTVRRRFSADLLKTGHAI
jgi:hypothetical protein